MPGPFGNFGNSTNQNINVAQHDQRDFSTDAQNAGAKVIQAQLGQKGLPMNVQTTLNDSKTVNAILGDKMPTSNTSTPTQPGTGDVKLPVMPTRETPTSVEEVMTQVRDVAGVGGKVPNTITDVKNVAASMARDEEAPYFDPTTGRWTVPITLGVPSTPAQEWSTPASYGESAPPLPPPEPTYSAPPLVSAPPTKKPSVMTWGLIAAALYFFLK